jgi:hypothetical protein
MSTIAVAKLLVVDAESSPWMPRGKVELSEGETVGRAVASTLLAVANSLRCCSSIRRFDKFVALNLALANQIYRHSPTMRVPVPSCGAQIVAAMQTVMDFRAGSTVQQMAVIGC